MGLCWYISFDQLTNYFKIPLKHFLLEAGGHLLERVTGGPALFRSHFSKLLAL